MLFFIKKEQEFKICICFEQNFQDVIVQLGYRLHLQFFNMCKKFCEKSNFFHCLFRQSAYNDIQYRRTMQRWIGGKHNLKGRDL